MFRILSHHIILIQLCLSLFTSQSLARSQNPKHHLPQRVLPLLQRMLLLDHQGRTTG